MLLMTFSLFFVISAQFVTIARADVKIDEIKIAGMATSNTIADADTYVDGTHQGSNYGGQTYLEAGYDIVYATYMHFNFTTEPQNVIQARIKFYVYSVSSTANLSVTIITTPWNEYSMTWANQPTGKTHVEYIVIPSTGSYYIDITNYIAGRNNISICLNSSTTSNLGLAYMDSRELSGSGPMIVWTYTTNVIITPNSITITNPTSTSSWLNGSSYYIDWISSGTSGYVNIEYYHSGSYYTIANDVLDNGYYHWAIPSTISAGNYKIYIEDASNYSIYAFSATFSITTTSTSGIQILIPGFDVAYTLLGFVIGLLGMVAIAMKKRHDSIIVRG